MSAQLYIFRRTKSGCRVSDLLCVFVQGVGFVVFSGVQEVSAGYLFYCVFLFRVQEVGSGCLINCTFSGVQKAAAGCLICCVFRRTRSGCGRTGRNLRCPGSISRTTSSSSSTMLRSVPTPCTTQLRSGQCPHLHNPTTLRSVPTSCTTQLRSGDDSINTPEKQHGHW